MLLVLPFIRYFMTKHIRQRFLLHQGTTTELSKDLQDYGIPTSKQFMSTRMQTQRNSTNSSNVANPSTRDGTTQPNGHHNHQQDFVTNRYWEDWVEERRQIEFIREEELFGPDHDDGDKDVVEGALD